MIHFSINHQRIVFKKGKKVTTYLLVYKGVEITVSENNINIENSYKITSKKEIREILDYIITHCECKVIKHRTLNSMLNEWVAHNNLYILHIARERTGSVDLNYPQEKLVSICYWFLSRIVL